MVLPRSIGLAALAVSACAADVPFEAAEFACARGGPCDAGVAAPVSMPADAAVSRPGPSIALFVASSTLVRAGGETVLTWAVVDADRVDIDGVAMALAAKGTRRVTVEQTTTFTLRAFNAHGMSMVAVTVAVAPPGSPVVRSFSVEPGSVRRGRTARLSWQTDGASSVRIAPGLGEGLPASGSITINPSETTTYELTASGAGQEAKATVSVAVLLPAPRVSELNATPPTFVPGEPVIISWTTAEASRVTMEPDVGAQPVSGSVTVHPTEDTTYRLNVVGPGGATSAEVTVRLVAPGAPQILELRASPRLLARGGASTVSWAVSGALSVSLNQGLGARASSGSQVVTPLKSTTYELSAAGPGGTTTAVAAVVVEQGDGDRCEDAERLDERGVIEGDTRTAGADYDPGAGGCTGFRAAGPDRVYRVPLQAGERLRAELTPLAPAWDAALYVVRGCSDVPASCIAGSDSVGSAGGGAEVVDFVAPAGGDYFLIVDGFVDSGAFTLSYDVTSTASSNDVCAEAIDVPVGGLITGSTSGANADYDPGPGGCTRASASGADVVYQIQLDAGERLQASLHAGWDSALYVVSDCSDVLRSCVAGQDDGDPEVIDFVAVTAGRYFLVVDGYGTGHGPFELSVERSAGATEGDVCGQAAPVPAGGGAFMSTTAGAGADYDPPATCAARAQPGPDLAYRLDLARGDVVEATATFGGDGALYAVTDCGQLSSCVAGADVGGAAAGEALRFVARQSGAHYVIVDGADPAGTSYDLSLSHRTGESCGAAPSLRVDAIREWLTLDGRGNDYTPLVDGCTGRTAAGPDRVYAVDLVPGDQLQARLDRTDFDAALYLLTDCGAGSERCVAGADGTGTEIIAPVVQQGGRYHLVVDRQSGVGGTGELAAVVVHGDTCNDAYGVPAGGGHFTGTTAGYAADYGTSSRTGSCTSWQQSGADAVYRINLARGQRLNATVSASHDVSLYLVSSCERSDSTCLAGEDDGDEEAITYTNNSLGDVTYYLMVDSWRVGTEGAYTLDVTIE